MKNTNLVRALWATCENTYFDTDSYVGLGNNRKNRWQGCGTTNSPPNRLNLQEQTRKDRRKKNKDKKRARKLNRKAKSKK